MRTPVHEITQTAESLSVREETCGGADQAITGIVVQYTPGDTASAQRAWGCGGVECLGSSMGAVACVLG